MAFQQKPALSLVPAAALGRPDPELVQQSDPADSLYAQPDVERAIGNFIGGLGGREALLTELLIAPELPPALLTLLTFSFDPRFTGQSFGYLCAKAQISPGEVFVAFRDVLAAKATIQAMHESSKELLVMLKELVRSAITHDETCPKCQGLTQIWKAAGKGQKQVPCPQCQQKGTVSVKPDPWAQEKVLDLVGLTRKSATQFVNNNVIQQNVQQTTGVVASGGDSPSAISAGLPQIQQALSTILFSRDVVRPVHQPIVDAEISPEVSASPTPPEETPLHP